MKPADDVSLPYRVLHLPLAFNEKWTQEAINRRALPACPACPLPACPACLLACLAWQAMQRSRNWTGRLWRSGSIMGHTLSYCLQVHAQHPQRGAVPSIQRRVYSRKQR